MVTAALLTSDQRLIFQIQGWMKDVGETVNLEVYREFSAFVAKIETEDVGALALASKNKTDDVLNAEDIGSGKSGAFEPFYRLLIIDLDLLTERKLDPVKWAKSFKELLETKGRSDPMYPTALIFMSFEGGDFRIESVRDPAVDDLIFKPLDKSVFLQKVEILTADDPAKLKPTFLFRQKVSITIEMGKDAVVDEISEFAIAMRNPTQIRPGVFASIHSSVFGEAEAARVIGRAYHSEANPNVPGTFLVYFGYFGLRSEQLTRVRKFVRERQIPAKFRVHQTPVPVIDPAVPFNNVAVIDMDHDVFHEIESALKDNYIGIAAHHFLSYSRFIATLIKMYPGPSVAPALSNNPLAAPLNSSASPVVPSATPALASLAPRDPSLRPWAIAGSLVYLVGAEDRILRSFETQMPADELILGKSKDEWLVRPLAWMADLEKNESEELEEMLSFTMSGGKGRALLKMKDQDHNVFYVEGLATFRKPERAEDDALIRVELKEIAEEVWQKSHAAHAPAQLNPVDYRYDAIFIDANLIRGELEPWIESLHDVFLKAGIFVAGEKMPKIVVMAHEKSSIRPEPYRVKGIADFVYKPLDRKMLSHKAKTVVDEFIARAEPEVPHFVHQKIDIKLAKDAHMEEISEYGLSISHPTPFKYGAMVRFFSSELGGSADGVLGRCSHCEKSTDKVPVYLCHFTFFGVSDEVLKHIRTWIREDYVHRKETPS